MSEAMWLFQVNRNTIRKPANKAQIEFESWATSIDLTLLTTPQAKDEFMQIVKDKIQSIRNEYPRVSHFNPKFLSRIYFQDSGDEVLSADNFRASLVKVKRYYPGVQITIQ